MRNFFYFFACFLSICNLYAGQYPESKKITVGGFERDYQLYLPSTYNNETGILMCLHGLNRSPEDFFGDLNIVPLAEMLNLAIIAPKALPEQTPKVIEDINKLPEDSRIPLDAVWGAGLYVDVKVKIGMFDIPYISVQLNKDIDDVTFLKTIIDENRNNYSLNSKRIYFLGTSLGGFMSYQYAMYHAESLAGLISIAGSMGTEIKNKENVKNLPICDFHSTTDEVVPYEGNTSTPVDYGGATLIANVSLCEKTENVISFWNSVNHPSGVQPAPLDFREANGKNVTKYTYSSPGSKDVIHYKITGAGHEYFFSKLKGDSMDYLEEIGNFIAANQNGNSIKNIKIEDAGIYPNPAKDIISIKNTNSGIISITDLSGKIISSGKIVDGIYNVSSLQQGLYLVKVVTGNMNYIGKMIKK